MSNSSKRISRKTQKGIVVVLVLIGAVFAFWKFGMADLSKKENIPTEFIEARERGSLLSAQIVEIYDGTINSLDAISQKDKEGQYYDALNLTLEGVGPNAEARKLSEDLALEIQKMAYTVLTFKADEARSLVLEGVAAEANLITHLIAYNGHFNDLLENLRTKFTGESSQDRVQEIITSMNEEAKIINRLNNQFNEKMAEFDSKYK